MKIDKFWVVVKPAEYSGLSDICFESTPQTIGLQFLGGLRPDNVLGFFVCGNCDVAECERAQREAQEFAAALIDHYRHPKDEHKADRATQ